MSAADAKKIALGSDVIQSPSPAPRTQLRGPGVRCGRKHKRILMPAALAISCGTLIQRTNLTAFSVAMAVLALAFAPALWQLSMRIRRFSHSKDSGLLMEFEEGH